MHSNEQSNLNKAFDFYEVKYKLEDKPFRYHFKIRSGNEICYYNKWGAESKLVDYYDFKIVPGFTAPGLGKRSGHVSDLYRPLL